MEQIEEFQRKGENGELEEITKELTCTYALPMDRYLHIFLP